MAWNKGLTAEKDERVKKQSEKRKENYINGQWTQNWHKWTDEEKEKIRQNTIKYIKSCKGNFKCRYSKKGCKYIDKLNEEKHWNL